MSNALAQPTDPTTIYDPLTGVAEVQISPQDAAAIAAAGLAFGDALNAYASWLIGVIKGTMTAPFNPPPLQGVPPMPIKP